MSPVVQRPPVQGREIKEVKLKEIKDMKLCTDCGYILEPDEEKSPRRDEGGDIVCDRCYDDRYQHMCPVCEEHFYEDYNQKISPKHFIITRQAEECHVAKAGFYEVIELPFYADGIIESQLFDSAINRLGDLPKDLDEDNLHFSLYFICEDCVKKMLENNHPGATKKKVECK